MIDARHKEGDCEEKTDILSRFMCLRDSNGKPYSRKWLRDICMNFFIAGRGK